jgi:hypothetical protein
LPQKTRKGTKKWDKGKPATRLHWDSARPGDSFTFFSSFRVFCGNLFSAFFWQLVFDLCVTGRLKR